MTEVTDKMFEAALKAFNNSQYSGGYRSTHIRSAIEAALAAREPADAGGLVKRLRGICHEDGEEQANWAAEQFEILCRNLLSRPPSRRGPFIINDTDLEAIIAGGSRADAIEELVEALKPFAKASWFGPKPRAWRSALEAALAAKEPVDTGKLAAELREHARDWHREPWSDSDVVMSDAADAIEELVDVLGQAIVYYNLIRDALSWFDAHEIERKLKHMPQWIITARAAIANMSKDNK